MFKVPPGGRDTKSGLLKNSVSIYFEFLQSYHSHIAHQATQFNNYFQ